MRIDVDRTAVERAFIDYLGHPGEDPPQAIDGARIHRALPLWSNWIGCLALRPSGELLFFSWDDPRALTPLTGDEHDQVMVREARAFASRRYPTIAGLSPKSNAGAEGKPLPQRAAPRPRTTSGMPHAQIGVIPEPAIDRELRRLAYTLPGVLDRPSVISVPGARALWLADEVPVQHPEAILRGREFAHIHPDGSLHAALPPQRAREAIDAAWAEPHPIAEQLGLAGLVLLYTPRTPEELNVVLALVVDSYNYVTGRSVPRATLAGEVP